MPPNHVSYVAFDIVVRNHDIFLALISQSGLLSLLEPSLPASLGSWREVDALYPFGQQYRDSESRFDLSFQQALGPSSQALQAGLDVSVLSLAVSSANGLKVYRALKSEEEEEEEEEDEDFYQLHEVGEVPVDGTFVNAIAWAPAGVNPTDIIAVACDDSTVRLVEITVQRFPANSLSTESQQSQVVAKQDSTGPQSIVPSGISAGFTAGGGNRTTAARNSTSTDGLKHEAKEIAVLSHGDGVPVYRVQWNLDGKEPPFAPLPPTLSFPPKKALKNSQNLKPPVNYNSLGIGSMLGSAGDDGRVHMWRQSIHGAWIEYSETGPTTT